MGHYEFTWATGLFIALISMGLMGGIFVFFLKILEGIYAVLLVTCVIIVASPILLLEFLIKGETSITSLKFLNKKEKKRLFDDW